MTRLLQLCYVRHFAHSCTVALGGKVRLFLPSWPEWKIVQKTLCGVPVQRKSDTVTNPISDKHHNCQHMSQCDKHHKRQTLYICMYCNTTNIICQQTSYGDKRHNGQTSYCNKQHWDVSLQLFMTFVEVPEKGKKEFSLANCVCVVLWRSTYFILIFCIQVYDLIIWHF